MPIVNKKKDESLGAIRLSNEIHSRAEDALAKVLSQSDGIKRPILAVIGNAVTGELYVPDTGNARVYISGQGDEPNTLGSIPAINIPKEFLRVGQPIKVRRNASGGFEYVGVDSTAGEIFNQGTIDEPDQTPITQSQLDFASLQPYSGLTAVVKGAIYGDDAVKDLVTADFSASPLDTSSVAINIPTTPNRAIGVLVQLNASTSTLSYKQSAEFNASLSLSAAYGLGLLPLRDLGLWRVGYLKLVNGITQFDYASVWTCAEWFSSGVSLPASSTNNAIALWDGTGGNALKNSTVTIDSIGNVGNVNALDFSTPTELTISGGAITITGSYHTVDTEADAATDDLETINGGTTGQLLFLRAANTARTVFLRNNTGSAPKIQNQYGDFALDNTEKAVVMLYDGTNWLALGMLSIPDMYVWGGNADGTLEFAAWDSVGEVYYKVTGDEIQQLRTAIITADDSRDSQPSLQVEFNSATDRTLTINSSTVAAGHSIFAHALQVSGGTGHKILLPSGVTWDGTNRAALFNAVDDALIAGAISSTRYVIYSNTGVTFAAS